MEGAMNFSQLWNSLLNDDRLLAHLVGAAAILGVLVLVSWLIYAIFRTSMHRFVCWCEIRWLHDAHEHAHRGLRRLIFWVTLGLMVTTIVAMGVYHSAGQDIRADVRDWASRLTGAHYFA